MTHHSKYFYGHEISDYGLENGYVDYATLAKAFDAVLNNEIMQKTQEIGYWEQESGFVDNTEEIAELREQIEELELNYAEIEAVASDIDLRKLEDKIAELEAEIEELEEEQDNSYYAEIYQYYIVSDNGAEILKEINEIVFYNEELDMYIWGVTHWGTAWSYVLTDIKIELDAEE